MTATKAQLSYFANEIAYIEMGLGISFGSTKERFLIPLPDIKEMGLAQSLEVSLAGVYFQIISSSLGANGAKKLIAEQANQHFEANVVAVTWANWRSDLVGEFVDDITHELLAHEQALGFYYKEEKGHGRMGKDSEWYVSEGVESFSNARQAIIEFLTITKNIIENLGG